MVLATGLLGCKSKSITSKNNTPEQRSDSNTSENVPKPQESVKATTIKLDKTTLTITMWDSSELSSSLLPTNSVQEKLTWSTSDISVAKVSNLGRITAINPGTATITVSNIDGNISAACSVEVKAFDDNLDITDKFTDKPFKEQVYKIIGKSSTSPILYEDVKGIKKLEKAGNLGEVYGIEYFTSLTDLVCKDTFQNKLDFSHNTQLVNLDCSMNVDLRELNIENNSKLKTLNCAQGKLGALDLNNCPELTYLNCSRNYIESLDISNNKHLNTLLCSWNKLGKLDVSNNKFLTVLKCDINQIDSLDIKNNIDLKELDISSNKINILDITNNTELTSLLCPNNSIRKLDLTNNKKLKTLDCTYNEITELVSSKDLWGPKAYSLQFDDFNHGTSSEKLAMIIK